MECENTFGFGQWGPGPSQTGNEGREWVGMEHEAPMEVVVRWGLGGLFQTLGFCVHGARRFCEEPQLVWWSGRKRRRRRRRKAEEALEGHHALQPCRAAQGALGRFKMKEFPCTCVYIDENVGDKKPGTPEESVLNVDMQLDLPC